MLNNLYICKVTGQGLDLAYIYKIEWANGVK